MVIHERTPTLSKATALPEIAQSTTMFPIHDRFPRLMPIIGRILVDYAEQEVDLLNCVQVIRGRDMNSTLKSMFRVRGEMNRIKIADALGRVPYTALTK
jgi:hypothetical protein